ncbi:GntR family transcriptional regulator [Atopobium fossor]|uniref:GntR family transcriptional regulator n=1 Tax=Atopobium fossor TaxID=39487 RepID=UPI00042A736E|nr:GntR family transcriptional regulator [Atopobium fossor]
MLKPVSSIPLHTQVANYIREKIYNREWEVGEKIPTEFELCEALGMSRGSIKRGISILVKEGILIQHRGRGTFVVNRNTISHPSGNTLLSFAESLKAQNIDFKTRVLSKEIISADFFISEKLFISVGDPVLLLKRVRCVEDEPIMYIENRVSLAHCPGLDKVNFEDEALFQSIEKCSGKKIGFSRAKYAAKVAGEQRGNILQIDESAPVLHLEQHIFYSDNTPTEWGNVWLRANRYVVGTVLLRAQ